MEICTCTNDRLRYEQELNYEFRNETGMSQFRCIIKKSRNLLKFPKDDVGNSLRVFDGYDEYFKKLLPGCQIYGEYGVGTSTCWVSKNTNARIIAVDTSYQWLETVAKCIDNPGRAVLKHIDVGPIGKWGRPISYSKMENFNQYFEGIWSERDKPDVVLIDGRFRVACFLTSLLRADEGTFLIFDDYVRRPHYHVIERFLKPVSTNKRQALFQVPSRLPLDEIKSQRDKFELVLD